MTDKRKTIDKGQGISFDMASCMAMMEQMMAGQDQGCDCADMMARCTDQQEVPDEWAQMMSQMMGFCCGTPEMGDNSVQEA